MLGNTGHIKYKRLKVKRPEHSAVCQVNKVTRRVFAYEVSLLQRVPKHENSTTLKLTNVFVQADRCCLYTLHRITRRRR